MQVLQSSPQRSAKTNHMDLREARLKGAIQSSAAERYSILRTFETSLELFSPTHSDTSVLCDHLLEHHNQQGASSLWDMRYSLRMNMLAHVPELNMVAVGSMAGRVAVLRLTQPPRGCQPRRCFRIEWILPRATEEDRGLRPYCSLLGIAAAPYPEPGAVMLNLYNRRRAPSEQPRYRLILHYMDHTILQYVISQGDPNSDDLVLRSL